MQAHQNFCLGFPPNFTYLTQTLILPSTGRNTKSLPIQPNVTYNWLCKTVPLFPPKGCTAVPTTHVRTSLSNISLFTLENDVRQFRIRNSIVSTYQKEVCNVHPSLWICNSKLMVWSINVFKQVVSSILNNFSKYQ
jgi:hypothetical protein